MRIRIHALLASALLVAAPLAMADHVIRVKRTVEVAVDADKAWAAVRHFDALHTWHPGVVSTKITQGGGDKAGTVRVLSTKGDGRLTETLTAHSDKRRSLSYRIDEGPLPVVGYSSTLAVDPGRAAGKAIVVWSASFKAKPGSSDADVKKLMENIFDAGLSNLQKQLGG